MLQNLILRSPTSYSAKRRKTACISHLNRQKLECFFSYLATDWAMLNDLEPFLKIREHPYWHQEQNLTIVLFVLLCISFHQSHLAAARPFDYVLDNKMIKLLTLRFINRNYDKSSEAGITAALVRCLNITKTKSYFSAALPFQSGPVSSQFRKFVVNHYKVVMWCEQY